MEMFMWAVGITLAFLFCMWMIIESDDYLLDQTRDPWKCEAKDDSKE